MKEEMLISNNFKALHADADPGPKWSAHDPAWERSDAVHLLLDDKEGGASLDTNQLSTACEIPAACYRGKFGHPFGPCKLVALTPGKRGRSWTSTFRF